MTPYPWLAPAPVNRQFPGLMLFLLLPSLLLRGAIRLYQLTLAYFFVGACRYEPSCSRYAEDAISHYGTLPGLVRTIGRLWRCSPWGTGGVDPAV